MSLDIFEKFLLEQPKNDPVERSGRRNYKNDESSHVVSSDLIPRIRVRNGRHRYQRGDEVNYVRVLAPHWQGGQNKGYTKREYVCECFAPTGPEGQPCGKKVIATYHQIYYGTAYSCGCLPKPHHPPVRLEGQTIGCIEVLRWTHEHGGTWELVCHECGMLLYRKSVHQVRGAGTSCASHSKEFV